MSFADREPVSQVTSTMFFPVTSPALNPNVDSARVFQKVIAPFGSVFITTWSICPECFEIFHLVFCHLLLVLADCPFQVSLFAIVFYQDKGAFLRIHRVQASHPYGAFHDLP